MWAALLIAVTLAAPVIEWVEPAASIAPGAIVSARVRVQAGPEGLAASEELRLPDGWESVFPLGEVSLEPGETTLRMLALRPTRRASAGSAELSYGLRRPDGAVAGHAVAVVDVLERIEFEAHVQSPPETLRLGDRASAEVTLRNRGNAVASVETEVACSTLDCELTPRSVELLPGETQSFELSLSIARGSKMSGPASAVVTLRAGDAMERVVVTTRLVSLKAAPPDRERMRGYVGVGGTSDLARSEVRGGLGLRGYLGVQNRTFAELSMRSVWTDDHGRVLEGRASVETDSMRFRADTALPSPSSLLRPGAGLGADLRVKGGRWMADGGVHRDRRVNDPLAWSRVGLQTGGWSARLLAAGTSGQLARAWIASQVAYEGQEGARASAEVSTHPENGALGLDFGVRTDSDDTVYVEAHHQKVAAGFRDAVAHVSTSGRATVASEKVQATAFARQAQDGSRTMRRLGANLRWREDQEEWSASGSLGGAWRKQVSEEGVLRLWEVDGQGLIRLDDQEAKGRLALSFEPVEGWTRLETTLQLGVGSTRHRVTALAKVDARTDTGLDSRFELAGRAGNEVLDLALGGQLSFGQHPTTVLQGAFGYRFGGGMRVDGEVRGGQRGEERLRGLRLNWTTPLSVASGPLTDFGTLSGRIYEHDAPDLGVGGVLVVLGERSALTRPDGSFRLRGVTGGDALVYLELGERGDGLVATEPMPLPVTLLDGGDRVLELGLARASSLEGTLVFARGGMGGGLGAGPNLDDGPLTDVLVELTRGRERLLRRTSREGAFAFRGLRPGQWTLTVHTGGLPVEVEIVDRVRMIDIESGSRQRLDVRARPAPRAMEIQPAFNLTSEP